MIQGYLFARKQRVQVQGKKSSFKFLKNGVPQGSVLSTLLFILFVNDIFKLNLKGRIQMYADDAAIVYSCPDLVSLAESINHDLDVLYIWFYENLLTFNVSKTKYMIIQQTGINVEDFPLIEVRGLPVQRVYSFRYLGLMIDHRLRWDIHVNFVKSKIRPFLAVLRKCANLIPEVTKLSLYYSAVHSHFLYLISIWGTTAVNRLDELARLQNKAVRFIFWREYHFDRLSTTEIYLKHKIIRVPELVKYESILTIFRIKAGILKSVINFPRNSELQIRTHRRQSFFYLPRSRTDYHLNSLSHRGIRWFNELPNEILREVNFCSFKRLLKDYILTSTS